MRVGLDIGSTTIKCVVLNDAEQIVYSTYERHYSHILEKGKELLHRAAQNYLPDGRAKLAISGTGPPHQGQYFVPGRAADLLHRAAQKL